MNRELLQRLILAFYMPSVLLAIAWAVMSPVLPVYASTLTESYLLVGVILAVTSLGRVFGSLPASWLLTRFGIRNTMLIGIALMLSPALALYLVRNLWLIIGLLFVVGIGLAIFSIARHTYISVAVPIVVRGRVISLLGGIFRAGLFVGPLIGGWVGGTFSLQTAFLAMFAIGISSVLFVLGFMRNLEASLPAPDEQQPRVSFGKMLRANYRVIGAAGAGQWLAMLTREGWRVLIPLYAANVLQLDVQTIGLVMGFGAAFDMLFFWLSGILMDRFGRKWAIVPSFIMQATGTALILVASNPLMLTIFAAFIGFANGISSGTMMTVGADLAPPDTRSEFLSLWSFIGDMGGVSGPMIVGAVAQAFIIQISILSIAGAGFGAAILFAVFVPETLKKRKTVPHT
ncbi:MAG: MFS transporter [Anaerolineae bacterium]